MAAETVAESLLPMRYGPVPLSSSLIVREAALNALMRSFATCRASVLTGPAGAGKSTLMAQWLDLLRKGNRRVAWLALERSDAACPELILGIFRACAAAGAGFATVLQASVLTALESSVEVAVHRLAEAVNSGQGPDVLLLDQFEAIDRSPSAALVAGLFKHALRLHIGVASRARPHLPLGALRGTNSVLELGVANLHFDIDETRVKLAGRVPELYVRMLHTLTDGSPIALQFACQSFANSDERPEGAGGWIERLHDYYREQVFENLPEAHRAAACRLAIVERFDISLAQAILGQRADEIVAHLLNVDGLLIGDRYWHEFHFPEILRRFLQRHLQELADQEVVALHRRAAAWFARRGLSHQSLLHSIAAGDRSSALELLNRMGSMAIGIQYGVPTLKSALSTLALAPEADDHVVPLGWAMIDVHEGRIAEAAQLVELVRSRIATDSAAGRVPTARVREDLLLCEALLGAFVDRPARATLQPVATQSGDQAPPDPGRLGLMHILMSWEEFAAGNLIASDREIDLAEPHYNESEAAYGSLFLHVHRCLVRYWRNDLDAALAESVLAERVAHLFFSSDERLIALTGILRQGLLFDMGCSAQPMSLLDLLGVVAALEGWGEIQRWAHHYAAGAAIRDGRFEVARGIYANGVEVGQRLGLPRLVWTMRCAIVTLETRCARLVEAGRLAEQIGLMELPQGVVQRGGAAVASDISDVERHAHALTWREHAEGLMTLAALQMRRGLLVEAQALLPQVEALLAGRSMTRLDAQLGVLRAHLALAAGDTAAVRGHLHAVRRLFAGSLSRSAILDLGEELEPYARELEGWPTPARARSGVGRPVPAHAYTPRDEALESSDPLTERERQILNHLREGNPNKITAFELGVSEATVKFHLRNIYRKLNARNRTQALARYRDMLTADSPLRD